MGLLLDCNEDKILQNTFPLLELNFCLNVISRYPMLLDKISDIFLRSPRHLLYHESVLKLLDTLLTLARFFPIRVKFIF
jgi:hypothetical protein